MKFWRMIFIALLALVPVTSALAQDKQTWAPTTLLEDSPDLAADYQRLLGKIDGAISDRARVDDLQNKIIGIIEAGGNPCNLGY